MPISNRLKYVQQCCLSGFELYSRWVPLICFARDTVIQG